MFSVTGKGDEDDTRTADIVAVTVRFRVDQSTLRHWSKFPAGIWI